MYLQHPARHAKRESSLRSKGGLDQPVIEKRESLRCDYLRPDMLGSEPLVEQEGFHPSFAHEHAGEAGGREGGREGGR